MYNKIIKIIITSLIPLFLVACTTTSTVTDKRNVSKPNFIEASDLNTRLAVGYIQSQQYKPAKDKLEKAIVQDPENVAAYKTLAYLYALLGLEKEANEKYLEALDLAPNDPDLLNSYGAFLCANGKLDEAQEQLKKAYDDPFYESIYLAQSNAGSCYVQQGEYKKAEPLLRKSLRQQPNLAGSLISMAEVGVKTERYLMARAYIERFHAVSPASAESLWIQLQAEKALGARDHYLKYARQLINDFPDSDEAGWVEAESGNEQFR
jgi:type IV pilus assembly protein PilF